MTTGGVSPAGGLLHEELGVEERTGLLDAPAHLLDLGAVRALALALAVPVPVVQVELADLAQQLVADAAKSTN